MQIFIDEEAKKAIEMLGDIALRHPTEGGNRIYNLVQSIYGSMTSVSKVELVEEKKPEQPKSPKL